MSEALLRDIAEYCRSAKMAESTFGRHAVNDGKLVSRLRLGGRVTTDTVERVRAFIAREPGPAVNGIARHLAPLPCVGTGRRPRRISDFTIIARNTFCSSRRAAKSGSSPNASVWSWATSTRAHPRCACSMPAPATAPCWRARCAPCTTGFRPCRSTSSPRRSASRTSGWCSKRCPTGCSSTRRPCWS